MNEEILEGKWKQIKGAVQKEWGELTDSDVDKAKGELTRLEGVIEEKYGHAKDDIRRKLNEIKAQFASLTGGSEDDVAESDAEGAE